MFEITTETARQYLREIRRTTLAEPAEVRELAGGVSNVVLLVTGHGGEPFVVKQARGRLRVKEEWLCPVERIWREVEVLRICGEVLGIQNSELRMQKEISASVPQVLWEDGENFLYAMTAAPAGHQTWKELLLAAFKPEAPVLMLRYCGRGSECGLVFGGETLADEAFQFGDAAGGVEAVAEVLQLRLGGGLTHGLT